MNAKARRTPDYLGHMLEAIVRIESYTRDLDRNAFEADPKTQDAVVRNLEVLGEAARNVLQNDPAFVAAHPDVPWAQAYRMRNALSHGYADIDMETVWNAVRLHLPLLKEQLRTLLDRGERAGSLFGRNRGSVRIREAVDLTEPTFDEPTDAETGRELEH